MIRNWIIAILPLTLASTGLSDSLPISYIERKPFYYTENGQPHGSLFDKVRAAAAEAKVAHQFVPMAIPRIMSEIRAGKKPYCSIGWYRTPERETFALFSAPFARDDAFMILAKRESAGQIDAYPSLAGLFANKDLTLGVASGFSYGEALDKLIHDLKPKLIDTEPSHGSLVSMLAKGRFSYMFVTPEELQPLLDGAGLKAADFHTRKFADMPPGAARYLMCSKATPKPTMEAINQAILKLFPGM